MLRAIDSFFFNKEEPVKSCFLFLRAHILHFNQNITEAWKYGMPFFCYSGKMFFYLWVDKKTHRPYIGIVEGRKLEHPLLVLEKRARIKTMQIDANGDIPVEMIDEILGRALVFYK